MSAVYDSSYQQTPAGNSAVANRSDSVPWNAFNVIVTGLVGLLVVVVGSGFAWLHGDLGDIKADVRDVRGSIVTISGRLSDTREDMLKVVGGLQTQAALANAKLDELTKAANKGR
jgi:hypothetical protein